MKMMIFCSSLCVNNYSIRLKCILFARQNQFIMKKQINNNNKKIEKYFMLIMTTSKKTHSNIYYVYYIINGMCKES